MKRSQIIRVTFGVALPCDATPDQVLEWITSELNFGGACDETNPLRDYDVEAAGEPILSDTGAYLHEVIQVDRADETGIWATSRRSIEDKPSMLPSAAEQRSAILDHLQNMKLGK